MTERFEGLRQGVREVCADFPDSYWRDLDAKREYPESFVRAMAEAGYLAPLIPKEYGGMGLGLAETTVILEERSPRALLPALSGDSMGSCR